MEIRLQPPRSLPWIPSLQHARSSKPSSRSSNSHVERQLLTSRRHTMPPVKVERMEPIVISDDDDAPKRESKKQPRILRTSRIILHPPIPTATINVLDQNQSPPLLLSPRKIGPSTRGDEGDARVIPRKHPRPKLISTWRPSKEIAATQKSIASFTHADPLRQQSKATASDPIDLCSVSGSSTSSRHSGDSRPQPSQTPRRIRSRSSGYGAHAKKHEAPMTSIVRTRENSSLKKGCLETRRVTPSIVLPLQSSIGTEATRLASVSSVTLDSSATPRKQRSTTDENTAYRSQSRAENLPFRSVGQPPRPRPPPGRYTLPSMYAPIEQWAAKSIDHSRKGAHLSRNRKTSAEEIHSASSSLKPDLEDLDVQQLICLPDGEAEQGVKERGHKEQVEVDEIRETVDMTSNAAPDLVILAPIFSL